MTEGTQTTSQQTVVVVEDDKDFAELLELKLQEKCPGINVSLSEFGDALANIEKIAPDVVVLDWFLGTPGLGKDEGRPVWELIWAKSFSPLVFASAADKSELPEFVNQHPLLQYVGKSTEDSAEKVVQAVLGFLPIGREIKTARINLVERASIAANTAVTETLPYIWKECLGDPSRRLMLERTARRRLTNHLAELEEDEGNQIFAWEQYIVPPAASHLMTGDVLRLRESSPDDPNSYRVILSPSCDLVKGREKVTRVLVAKCVPIDIYRSKHPPLYSCKDAAEKKKAWRSLLSQPQTAGYSPMPAFPSLIPHMAVSLKELDLLELDSVAVKASAAAGPEFERVASTDSPFREQLAWAYMLIACRPGMPDRNIDSWVNEIEKL